MENYFSIVHVPRAYRKVCRENWSTNEENAIVSADHNKIFGYRYNSVLRVDAVRAIFMT